eukprot:6174407-Pleurochrysis_carterae.AAC.3
MRSSSAIATESTSHNAAMASKRPGAKTAPRRSGRALAQLSSASDAAPNASPPLALPTPLRSSSDSVPEKRGNAVNGCKLPMVRVCNRPDGRQYKLSLSITSGLLMPA